MSGELLGIYGENQFVSSERQEIIKPKPYVVSGDIAGLTKRWADKRGFVMPPNGMIAELQTDLQMQMQRMFPVFDYVPEDEIASGMADLVRQTDLLPISMDRVYFPTTPRIDIARIVTEDGNDKGLGARTDAESLFRQFRRLRDLEIDKAVLVDDVLFSGGLMVRIRKTLQAFGIETPVICTGIAIQDGVDILAKQGATVQAVRTYPDVIDEVCERDFFVGVPLSGRTISHENNVGAPYILPFGKPEEWASIPTDQQTAFSRRCIERSMALFSAIEQASGRPVACADLDRNVISMPTDSTRFVEALAEHL